MRYFPFLGLLALCACGKSGHTPATGTLPGTVTLATYNVRNFFDEFDNPYTADGNPKKPAELAQLAEALHLLDADVVVLQEVEFGGFLTKFTREKLADMQYTAVESPTTDPRGISVAGLSRLPVLKVVSHRFVPLGDGTSHFARDLLRADLQLSNGQTLVVYGVHLKSKLASAGDDTSAKWRLAEGLKIAEIMKAEMATEHLGLVALCGDFNDNPNAPSRAAIMKDTGLVDVLAGRSQEDRVTFVSTEFRDSPDDVLLSPGLAAYFDAANATVLRGGVFETASDHRPVRVRLGK